MTTHDDRSPVSAGATPQQYAAQAPVVTASGPGNAFPATATGVPLSVFTFGFSVGILGLVDTGILSGLATGMFVAVALGTGALGLFVGGLWDFRGGNLFGGTFGVAYGLFLLTTGLIVRFFAPAVITAAGLNAYRDAFAAWLILWAVPGRDGRLGQLTDQGRRVGTARGLGRCLVSRLRHRAEHDHWQGHGADVPLPPSDGRKVRQPGR